MMSDNPNGPRGRLFIGDTEIDADATWDWVGGDPDAERMGFEPMPGVTIDFEADIDLGQLQAPCAACQAPTLFWLLRRVLTYQTCVGTDSTDVTMAEFMVCPACAAVWQAQAAAGLANMVRRN